MAQPAPNFPRITAKDYLELERNAASKHEFVDGVAYAMAGVGRAHNLIAGGINDALFNGLKRPCIVYGSDMKVRVKVGDVEQFFYPDAHVTCSDLDRDPVFNDRPVLIVQPSRHCGAGKHPTLRVD
jgi:Uma2 family endonuclease